MNTTPSMPSSFDSINARALTPVQVAQTFVPSVHFEELCRPRHSIVLGPRGSGKTTLLKMLQPAALAKWQHPDAASYAAHVSFTGIFVATDISWNEQLSLLGRRLPPDVSRLLSVACFTTHSLRAVLASFQQRVCGPSLYSPSVSSGVLDKEIEARIVSTIAKAWHVSSIVPSFLSLRHALTQRLLDIRVLGSREAIQSDNGRQERLLLHNYLYIPFLEASAYAIEVFEAALGIPPGKWGYSFDELELAPETIQQELIRSLRSTDDRFLFKLALNPFTSNTFLLQHALSPAPGQDFDQISLWYAEKRVAQAFCEGLWKELARRHDVPDWTPQDVLGSSYFESSAEDVEHEIGAYAPGSRWAKRFQSLADKDPSFRRYLQDRSIDLAKLHLLRDEVRASEVRKIAPVVAIREFYLRDTTHREEPVQELSSRKTATLYTGADSVFALTEGNPRIFIGLVGLLLSRAKGRLSSSVSPMAQAVQLKAAAETFLATLRTIPREEGGIGVVALLRRIAVYFHDDSVKGEFKSSPIGSFIVDSHTPETSLKALEQALNAGAIIYVPDDAGQVILTSLRGKRFRLSYLLAPVYGFPIRLGRDKALSRILGVREALSVEDERRVFDFTGGDA